MIPRNILCVAGLVCVIASCSVTRYVDPQRAGLDAVAPYPTGADVCQTLSANSVTQSMTNATSDLIGCPSHERGAIKDRQSEGFVVVGQAGSWSVLRKLHPVIDVSPPTDPVRHGYEDKTVLFYDPFHGTQVAYFTNDSREWLWYPGNKSALMGFVRVQGQGGGQEICFSYPASSYNPATGVAGPDWECTSMARHRTRIVSERDGDVFNLSSGRIPYVTVRKQKYDFDSLSRTR